MRVFLLMVLMGCGMLPEDSYEENQAGCPTFLAVLNEVNLRAETDERYAADYKSCRKPETSSERIRCEDEVELRVLKDMLDGENGHCKYVKSQYADLEASLSF